MNRPRTRIHVASAIAAATFALFVAATTARAASPDFAAVTWVPQCGVDPAGDESPASADLVGNAANPSTYTGQDASFIYFRYRLNANPAGSGNNPFVNVAWVSLLNVPSGNPFRYQYLLALNGDLGTVELWSNNTATATDIHFTPLFNDPAETKLFSQVYNLNVVGINTGPLARIVGPLTTNFGGNDSCTGVGLPTACCTGPLTGTCPANPDYFIEVAYPISVLISNGVIANAGDLASVRYFLATSANSNNYNKDSECQFVPQTTLGITKSVSPSSIPVNGTTPIDYTITVANSGNANATGVVIDDTTLPSYMTGVNVTVSSSSPSVSWTIVSTNPLKVKVNSMPPGATITVRITANASPHCADGNFTNTATAVAINAVEVSADALLTITKNAPEICNGIDDNCNGQVDEGGSALCDNANACDGAETCGGAAGCQAGTGVVCVASDQCHDPGVCQPGTGLCSNPPKANGATCNDGNACTQTDSCQAGACVGGNGVVCSASDQCHSAGTCDPGTGVCSNPTKPNGASCSDGNSCTNGDVCQAGSCTPGTGTVCAAQDQCHVAGTCDPGTGVCSNPNKADGTTCNDGDLCSQTDTCQAGSCQGANPKTCTALDQCHDVGDCNPGTGVCSNPSKSDGSACSDGNACTQQDSCQAGACTGTNPVTCEPLDQCHAAGTCNTATGACSNPNKSDGTTCSDGDLCTQTDTCQAGSCQGANPKTCTALDQCHEVGDCNPGTGVCSNPSKSDGSTCSDGNACTQQDSCQGGTCSGTNPVNCEPLDQCHAAGTCNTTTGLCSNPNKTDGTTCNDGDLCTQTDTCQAGSCQGANPKTCTALDQCHEVGDCNPGTGVCSNPTKPDGESCNNPGNLCNQTNTCQAGACTGSNPVVCAAPDQCHNQGTCNLGTGTCEYTAKADGTTCNDGNLCTQTDTCQAGSCDGSNPKTCTALNECHEVGDCNPSTGLCTNPSKPDGSACTDGNACTQEDACQAGSCVGTDPKICEPLDQCHDAGTCNTGTGVCSNPNKTDGTACNDGNLCTQTDTCQAGSCDGSNPKTCTALNECHEVGDCNPSTGLCTNPSKPDGSACTDGNACTQEDACQAGACVGTDPKICAPLDQCHAAGTCNTGTGVCSDPNKTDGTACNDGDLCTQTDTCQAGSCDGSNPKTCTAQNQCHEAGTCNPSTGQCSNPSKNDGTSCADGDACTTSDTCQAGSCEGAFPVVCPDPDQCHAQGTCNHQTGTCSNPPAPNGTVCTDGNGCTQTDICTNGSCQGTNPVTCTVQDQCHTLGTCDQDTGMCSNPIKANDSPCNDGDKCTQIDVCESGICFGTDRVECTASDQCHVPGSCDSATGTCSNPTADDGVACNDLNACTLGDHCEAGSCVKTTDRNCATPNPCATGACNPSSTGGCFIIPNDAGTCSDGDACTTGEHCSGGTCVPGTTFLDCDTNNVCTEGQCNNAHNGCFTIDLETSCNDGLACTDNDMCGGGTCHGGPQKVCNDNEPCTDDACVEPAGCVYTPDDTNTCSDGSNCTQPDQCQGGHCVGTPINCDDHDICTDDSCDDHGGDFNCLHERNLDTCPPPPCGNGVLDPGETCDPPNLNLDPVTHQTICRLDCTSCGDGVVQNGTGGEQSDGEDCDDGNTVDGLCRRLTAIDKCLNNCSPNVCEDPALIKFRDPHDMLKFHGQVVWDGSIDFVNNHFVFELQDVNHNVLFRSSLIEGSLISRTSTSFLFKNRDAKFNGGVYKLRIKAAAGAYKIYLTSYGDLSASIADMVTHVYVGTIEWQVHGIWQPTTNGWKLNGKSDFLPVS